MQKKVYQNDVKETKKLLKDKTCKRSSTRSSMRKGL